MIFLAALLFLGLLFVIPGEIVLVIFAHSLATQGLGNYVVWLTFLNVGVFIVVLIGVRSFPQVYADFRLIRGKHHREVKHLFDVTGCEWISGLGIVTTIAFASTAFAMNSFPLPLWYLVVVALAGFLNLRGRSELLEELEDLPPPRFSSSIASLPLRPMTEASSSAQPELSSEPTEPGHAISLSWDFGLDAPTTTPLKFCYEAVISEKEYKLAREISRFSRRPHSENTKYVLRASDSVSHLAAWFRRQTQEHRFSSLQEVVNVATMVRTIPSGAYETSRAASGYTNFPVETLYEAMADRNSHAILAAAVLHDLGHEVALIVLDSTDNIRIALGYHHPASSGAFSAKASDGRDFIHIETFPTELSTDVAPIEFLAKLSQTVVLPLA